MTWRELRRLLETRGSVSREDGVVTAVISVEAALLAFAEFIESREGK